MFLVKTRLGAVLFQEFTLGLVAVSDPVYDEYRRVAWRVSGRDNNLADIERNHGSVRLISAWPQVQILLGPPYLQKLVIRAWPILGQV